MTQKFNVGDIVRCVQQSNFEGYQVPLGVDCTVARFHGMTSCVDLVEYPNVGACMASRFVLAPTAKFVLMFPNGEIDNLTFDTEAAAAEAGEDAFDAFSVHQLTLVAKYSVETTTNLLRAAA